MEEEGVADEERQVLVEALLGGVVEELLLILVAMLVSYESCY